MKVEYPLLLVQKFNRKILTNKVFSYFLVAFIIAFIIILRDKPYIYYKYLYNPFVLIILILLSVITITFNKLLGIMLTILLISLFFPKIPKYESIENFEGDELAVVPVSGEDKNIVDDEKEDKNKDTSDEDLENEGSGDEVSDSELKNTKSPEKTNEKDKSDLKGKKDKKEKFKDESSEPTSAPTPELKSDYHKNSVDSDSLNPINLEQIHVGFFKNKQQNTDEDNKKNKSNKDKFKEKFQNNKPKRTRVLPRVARLSQLKESNSKSNNKENQKNEENQESFKTTKKQNNSDSFIGDVRQIINDLDKGKNKMNAKNAIKEINTLMFTKHRSDIQKIIDSDDEDDEEESDDDDYY